MPKRKRENEEMIERYKKKIKRLEKKQKKKKFRRVIPELSSSESDHTPDVEQVHDEANNSAMIEVDPLPAPPSPVPAEPTNTDSTSVAPSAGTDIPESNEEVSSLPALDTELLLALGEETGNTPKFGEKIHNSLAQRWEPILKKGLPKEIKDKLIKEHLVPENCTLLQAPKLNVEVAAAVSETSRQRDKRKETEQQQLGIGISAINRAMTILLTSENKIEAIKLLSDGCRILTDLHFQETQSRISVINFALAKPFLNVVQDNERDETLYGVKLSEKIKASKVIEKQGMQIKKYTKPQKTAATEQMMANTRPQYQQGSSASNQGNWTRPSRFQQNRGGRRGQRRTPAIQSRRPPPSSTTSTSAAGQVKTRAPSRP